MFKYSVYLPQGKKTKRLNEEPAVGIRGRTMSSTLIDSVYSIYSAGSSGNSTTAVLYSAGNSGNSAAAICYNTVLEILERVELFYNFYRVGNSGKSWFVGSADGQGIGRTIWTRLRKDNVSN
ncbi:hypothetical protein KY285_035430 [Solanum tuberosum]|nr:hypothetical protein KY285_035430 [Solanum tuberosum]